jgi:hypothetical protein
MQVIAPKCSDFAQMPYKLFKGIYLPPKESSFEGAHWLPHGRFSKPSDAETSGCLQNSQSGHTNDFFELIRGLIIAYSMWI